MMVQKAKDAGAKGINLVGMCCSGAEMMSRHGIPHAGNFMSTETVLVTGAVDAMCVDVQCIKQGLAKVADCYGTPLITTNPRCHIEGAEHIEFHEHTPRDCTDAMVIKAIHRFKNRNVRNRDPQEYQFGRPRFFPRVHQLHAGRHLPRILYPAERQHHQRPHPRRGRGGGLHQPPGQTGLGACRTGQGTDQERRSGCPDRLFPDCPGQGRPARRKRRTWPAAASRKCARPSVCRRYWGLDPASTTAGF
jgi:hypothetical protein